MANWSEFSKAHYKSTKRDLINSGKPWVKKKDVYQELKKKFKALNTGEPGTVVTVSAPQTTEELSHYRKTSVSTKPRIVSTGRIKKSNIEFLHKFYKLTSRVK